MSSASRNQRHQTYEDFGAFHGPLSEFLFTSGWRWFFIQMNLYILLEARDEPLRHGSDGFENSYRRTHDLSVAHKQRQTRFISCGTVGLGRSDGWSNGGRVFVTTTTVESELEGARGISI